MRYYDTHHNHLSTVANCEQIHIIKGGHLHTAGTYPHPLNTNTELQRLAEARQAS